MHRLLHTIFAFMLLTNQLYGSLHDSPHEFVLKNERIEVHVAKKTGAITRILVHGHTILNNHAEFYSANLPLSEQPTLAVKNFKSYADSAFVSFIIPVDDETIELIYGIDATVFRCNIIIKSITQDHEMKGTSLDLVLSLTEEMTKAFYCGTITPIELHSLNGRTFTYREDFYIPMVSVFSDKYNIGFSIMIPPEVAKPSLQFLVNDHTITLSEKYVQLSSETTTSIEFIIIPHEGDWRQGLAYFQQEYPDYFHSTIDTQGWFYLSFPFVSEKEIQEHSDRGLTWIELHEYFPFYGLYAPNTPQWNILIDSSNATLLQWERGNGGKTNSYDHMAGLVEQWQQYGVKVYLYYQVFEAWLPYAQKYFPDDIAKDHTGKPLPAWKFTALMNPMPGSVWSTYITEQLSSLLYHYPTIDGIFLDRIDYHAYDFAHNDSITFLRGKPAYMLATAQEKMNEILVELLHGCNKEILANGPTSIEVCKNLDGLMAEKSIKNLIKIQYLGLSRPIVFLPYDHFPHDTEEKLKYALLCGACPALSYGGLQSQALEHKYVPLFELCTSRQWVLNAHPLEFPEDRGLLGNIFKCKNGDYAIVIISPHKSQLMSHSFEFSIPLCVKIENVGDIRYAYLLSGDWYGVNTLSFKKTNNRIELTIPVHLACTFILLSGSRRYDVTRTTLPLIIVGQSQKCEFRAPNIKTLRLAPTSLLGEEKRMSDRINYDISAAHDGSPVEERSVILSDNDRSHHFSFWIIDPIMLSPAEDIFIHNKKGDYVDFIITNNINKKIKLNIAYEYSSTGYVKGPDVLTLKPYENMMIQIFVHPQYEGDLRVHIAPQSSEYAAVTRNYHVQLATAPSNRILFADNFDAGMTNWTIDQGTWAVSDNAVQGYGAAHLAYIADNTWADYSMEVTSRCLGSSNANIDWLKSYIFFRLQDNNNFYRFGIHGDASLIDLYKCIHGEWTRLKSTPFIPEKNKWYTLKATANGSLFTCYINGKQVFSVRDDTFLSGGIGIGVLEDNMMCEYKNISIQEAGSK